MSGDSRYSNNPEAAGKVPAAKKTEQIPFRTEYEISSGFSIYLLLIYALIQRLFLQLSLKSIRYGVKFLLVKQYRVLMNTEVAVTGHAESD
jgi:hypothetical protein